MAIIHNDFIRDAKTFVEVFNLGSISAYSKLSGEHRTTISKRLLRVQETSSTKLFFILKGNIHLTEEGKSFLIAIKSLLKNLDTKLSKLLHNTNNNFKKLTFLTSADAISFFSTKILTKVLMDNPAVSINLKTFTHYQLVNNIGILRDLLKNIDMLIIWENYSYIIENDDWFIKKRFSTRKNIYASHKYVSENQDILSSISDINKH